MLVREKYFNVTIPLGSYTEEPKLLLTLIIHRYSFTYVLSQYRINLKDQNGSGISAT